MSPFVRVLRWCAESLPCTFLNYARRVHRFSKTVGTAHSLHAYDSLLPSQLSRGGEKTVLCKNVPHPIGSRPWPGTRLNQHSLHGYSHLPPKSTSSA